MSPELRVFVSYSHADSHVAARFRDYFGVFLQGYHLDAKEVVYFDQDRLLAGDEYEPILEEAIRGADLFIFLVSVDSLKKERYCMRVEVPLAAQYGIPIVPVILSRCPWERQPISGAPPGHTLDGRNALPRGPEGLKPVADWDRPDQAWSAVVDGLLTRIEKIVGVRGVPRAVRPLALAAEAEPAAEDVGLVPYLCGNRPAVGSFRSRLTDDWDERALVVLVKGVDGDNPPQFWYRLRHQILSKFVARDSRRRPGLAADDKPLTLPVEEAEDATAEELRRTILFDLSDAVTQDDFQCPNVRTLATVMRETEGVFTFLAIPPVQPEPALRGSLEALLDLLAGIRRREVLRRTLVVVLLQDAGLDDRAISDEWELHRHPWVRVVELGPLKPVTKLDVHHWHLKHQIFQRFRLEVGRVEALFGKRASLRLRDFDAGFQSLVGPRKR